MRWCLCNFFLILVVLSTASSGCQPDYRVDPGLKLDYTELMKLPGSQSSPARAQKPERQGSPLEIGPDDPGNRDARAARIRAVVNGDAILDEEVIAAAFQQLMRARDEQEKADILNKKLTEIIERELLLQEAAAKLGKKKGFMEELKSIANKEFDRQWMQPLMRANRYTEVEAFRRFLQDQGMPVDMVQRQWVRNFIAMEYVRSRVEPAMTRIGHLEVVEYYKRHPREFVVGDSLTWQDIFIANIKHGGSQDAARQFAESLRARISKGEDFIRLAREFDNGDSSLRENSEGLGHKRGEIQPAEAESVLFSLKEGEVGPLIEKETGFHIVRVTKRTYAGQMPLDDQLQKQIKDKLRNAAFETEMKQIIAGLKRKAIIDVAREIK